jgi:RND family efflux transporter MFP subunit
VSDLKTDLAALRLGPQETTPRRRPWIPLIVLLTVAAVGLWAWRASAGYRALEVETVQATARQAATMSREGQPVLTASGYLVARRDAVVSAKIQGRLSELRVEEGDRVQKGEVIAMLENADFIANVQRARATLQELDAQVERAEASIQRADADLAEFKRQMDQSRRLAKEQVVARDALEASESRVRIAEAQLAQARADRAQLNATRSRNNADLAFAQAQLDNTVIRSPFAGTVVRKMAEVGESVAPIPPGVNISTASGAIVALADLATLEMEADVAEANVAQLVDNQQADITVEAFPDKHYRAVLRQVIPTADRTKATVMVKVTLIDKDDNLKPEMSAKVTFLERAPTPTKVDAAKADAKAPPSPPVVTAPQSAVVTRNGTTQVFEVVQDLVKARPVTTGQTRQNDVTITKGLGGGEVLVNRPPEALKDGDRVRVKQ